jgi:hypothetical protein
LLIFSGFSILLFLATVFLYKNRKSLDLIKAAIKTVYFASIGLLVGFLLTSTLQYFQFCAVRSIWNNPTKDIYFHFQIFFLISWSFYSFALFNILFSSHYILLQIDYYDLSSFFKSLKFAFKFGFTGLNMISIYAAIPAFFQSLISILITICITPNDPNSSTVQMIVKVTVVILQIFIVLFIAKVSTNLTQLGPRKNFSLLRE